MVDLVWLVNKMLANPVGWSSMVSRDTVCSYCNQRLPLESRSLDHIVPLSIAGKGYDYNITMACVKCNGKKGASSLLMFLISSGGIK